MVSWHERLLRWLYGALFVVVVPPVLLLWARASDAAVPLPAVHSGVTGLAAIVAGGVLVAFGWYALIVHGHGLPMNAFPPPRFVRVGLYRWIRNPIYIGFGLIIAGVSIAAGSPSGLWLVTPTVILATTALVFGFERIDLVQRFGTDALQPPLLSIPRGNDAPPTINHRLAVCVWILIPWLLRVVCRANHRPATGCVRDRAPVRTAMARLAMDRGALCLGLSVRANDGVPRGVAAGASRSGARWQHRHRLRDNLLVYHSCCSANRSFVPTNALGELLAFEQRSSTGVAAFPAFHVLWAMLAARVWSDDARHRHQPSRAWIGWTWAGLIAASCLTTGMHSVIEVVAALLLFTVLREPARSWTWMRARTEALANSWREWQIGPVRVINHAVFAAAAGGVGFAIIAIAVPPDRFLDVVWMTLCTSRRGRCLGTGL